MSPLATDPTSPFFDPASSRNPGYAVGAPTGSPDRVLPDVVIAFGPGEEEALIAALSVATADLKSKALALATSMQSHVDASFAYRRRLVQAGRGEGAPNVATADAIASAIPGAGRTGRLEIAVPFNAPKEAGWNG